MTMTQEERIAELERRLADLEPPPLDPHDDEWWHEARD